MDPQKKKQNRKLQAEPGKDSEIISEDQLTSLVLFTNFIIRIWQMMKSPQKITRVQLSVNDQDEPTISVGIVSPEPDYKLSLEA